jgi:hypothetical protein
MLREICPMFIQNSTQNLLAHLRPGTTRQTSFNGPRNLQSNSPDVSVLHKVRNFHLSMGCSIGLLSLPFQTPTLRLPKSLGLTSRTLCHSRIYVNSVLRTRSGNPNPLLLHLLGPHPQAGDVFGKHRGNITLPIYMRYWSNTHALTQIWTVNESDERS